MEKLIFDYIANTKTNGGVLVMNNINVICVNDYYIKQLTQIFAIELIEVISHIKKYYVESGVWVLNYENQFELEGFTEKYTGTDKLFLVGQMVSDLKIIAVKAQKYELAAKMRDIEKRII
jgi:hypothetical protein